MIVRQHVEIPLEHLHARVIKVIQEVALCVKVCCKSKFSRDTLDRGLDSCRKTFSW